MSSSVIDLSTYRNRDGAPTAPASSYDEALLVQRFRRMEPDNRERLLLVAAVLLDLTPKEC